MALGATLEVFMFWETVADGWCFKHNSPFQQNCVVVVNICGDLEQKLIRGTVSSSANNLFHHVSACEVEDHRKND